MCDIIHTASVYITISYLVLSIILCIFENIFNRVFFRTMDVNDLKEKYCQIIGDYLENIGDSSVLCKYLKLKDGRSRFWNCMAIQKAKNGVLWASINPSGTKKEDDLPEENVLFNQEWNLASPPHTYWGYLIQRIMDIRDVCGHMDLLPIHIGDEKEIRKMLFTTEDTPERALTVNLLSASQEMIECLMPRLIIYSNATTAFLWGTKANQGIYWMGYELEEVSGVRLKCWEQGKGTRGLYRIIGIHKQSINTSEKTNLVGTYLLIDYQVGGRQESSGIKKEEVCWLWDWVKKQK